MNWGMTCAALALMACTTASAEETAKPAEAPRETDGAELGLKTQLRNNVFNWTTADGRFSLRMQTGIQIRVTYNEERGQDVDSDDGAAVRALSTNGRDFWNFRVVRARTTLSGNVFGKEWRYSVILNWVGNNNVVDEAFMSWSRFKEFNVAAGQTKVPTNYQWKLSYSRQQFVERSVASNQFAGDWGKGLWLFGQVGDTPWIKYFVGVFNGVLRANNDFRNQDRAATADIFSQAVDADLMPVVRVETHPLGQVADDMTDFRGRDESKKILFSFGVSLNWLMGRFVNTALRPTSTANGSGRSATGYDTIHLSVDGHFRFYGLSVNIEYHHRHTEFHNFGPLAGNGITRNRNRPGDLTDNALLFEAGFFILPKQFDVGLRFGMVDADEFWLNGSTTKRNGLLPDSTEAGVALGYYLGGHNLKIQADFTYITYQLVVNTGTVPNLPTHGKAAPTRSASSIANDNSDYLNVWQFRLQVIWIF